MAQNLQEYLQENADVIITPTHDHQGALCEPFVPEGSLFLSELTLQNRLIRLFITPAPTIRVALLT